MEAHRRSIVKAVTYRLFATTIVFGMAFAFTGQLGAAAKISVAAAVAKTRLYYLWKLLWSHISWGVQEH